MSGPRTRMFVALDLPEEVRLGLGEWRDSVAAGRGDLRRVPAEDLHVTLAFLGWQDESAAPGIAEAAFGVVEGLEPPLLSAQGVQPVPAERPRLFALDLSDEDSRASRVQGAMSDSLEKAGVYKPEKRPFWPHVTLARVKRGKRAEPLPDLPPPGEAFSAPELTLYRSTLRPEGPLYEPLARARVGEPFG